VPLDEFAERARIPLAGATDEFGVGHTINRHAATRGGWDRAAGAAVAVEAEEDISRERL
jgi:hypothetical protein